MKKPMNVILKVMAWSLLALLAISCADSRTRAAKTSDAKGGELLGSAENLRPERLKINKVPDRVRYVSIGDDLILKADVELDAMLRNKETAKFSPQLLVFPGLMETISGRIDTARLSGKKMKVQLNIKGENKTYFGAVYQEQRAKSDVWQGFLRMVGDDSIRIRTLKSEEMSLWWIYIPFDITEPIFVVNDRFVVGMNKRNAVSVIDDLSKYTASGIINGVVGEGVIKLETIRLLNTDEEMEGNFTVDRLSAIIKEIDEIVIGHVSKANRKGEFVVMVSIENDKDSKVHFSGDIEKLGVDSIAIKDSIHKKMYRSKIGGVDFELLYRN